MTKFADYFAGGRRSPRLTAADGLEIRVDAPGDLEPIAEISAEREEKSVEECRNELARLREQVRSGRAQLFVGDLAGTVVGFGKVAHFSPPASSGSRCEARGRTISRTKRIGRASISTRPSVLSS